MEDMGLLVSNGTCVLLSAYRWPQGLHGSSLGTISKDWKWLEMKCGFPVFFLFLLQAADLNSVG